MGPQQTAAAGELPVLPGPRGSPPDPHRATGGLNMVEIGCFLSSEEQGPKRLVEIAKLAEESGFRSVLISDHYHPSIDRQGESAFVWGVIGSIAATTHLQITTAVTCPTVRIHPAILAQA